MKLCTVYGVCLYKAAYVCAWMELVVHVCKFANDDFRVLVCVRVAKPKCVYVAVCTLCVCEANTIT